MRIVVLCGFIVLFMAGCSLLKDKSVSSEGLSSKQSVNELAAEASKSGGLVPLAIAENIQNATGADSLLGKARITLNNSEYALVNGSYEEEGFSITALPGAVNGDVNGDVQDDVIGLVELKTVDETSDIYLVVLTNNSGLFLYQGSLLLKDGSSQDTLALNNRVVELNSNSKVYEVLVEGRKVVLHEK